MVSLEAFLFVLCVSVGLSQGGVIDRVDRVLQNLVLQRSQVKSDESSNFRVENLNELLNHGSLFKNFVLEYEKVYETDEEIEKRFDIFRDNLKIIDRYNKHELGTATYGINKFADLTTSEFKNGLSPINWDEFEVMAQNYESYKPNASSLYGEDQGINYLKKGKVLEKVQDQQMCGSCWAHSATASIESAYAIKHNELIEFSKQQLVDCDFLDGGCCGGWPFRAYDYIKHVGGLMTEKDYRQRYYEGPCKFNQQKAKVNIDKRYVLYNRDTKVNAVNFQKFLKEVGPMVAIINAEGFRFYKGGVMNQPDLICDKSTGGLNHAVLNIGFDYETIGNEKSPYWIIKNSWGKKWGESGYIRIMKGQNVCGMEWIATGLIVE
uniref:Cysteine proteinase CG12163 n=1 Tax=Cacopsylla melanoneura TaxID=428564 RepID=A0A8D9F5P5_9HEMI